MIEKLIKEVVEWIKCDRKVKEQIEQIKGHAWEKEIERS